MLKILTRPKFDEDQFMSDLEKQLKQSANGPPAACVSERLGAQTARSSYESYRPIDSLDRLRNTMLDMTETEWVEFGRQFGTFPKRMPTRAHFIAALKLWAIDAFKDQVQGQLPSPHESSPEASAASQSLADARTSHQPVIWPPGYTLPSESSPGAT